ncbi:MAG TPA: DUF3558 domain-containing protein, partial [Pseudonocardiaceae bacterium]|nr:DUF3558 domain-containing protein [Pseudonocardiaceae bacterium]
EESTMSDETGSAAEPGDGRRRTGLLAAVLMTSAVTVSAGCGYLDEADGAEPIPRVERPRDITAVADRPCELLTPQQAARFGLDRPPRQIQGRLGNVECEWRSSQADVWVYISTFTNRPTLEQVYDRRESLAQFELTRIGGYPAIVSRTDETLPVCDIDIKPAERQSVTVSYDSTEFNQRPQEGCRVGRQVAETVVSNLPSTG